MPLHSPTHIGHKAIPTRCENSLRSAQAIVTHPTDRIDPLVARTDHLIVAPEGQKRVHDGPRGTSRSGLGILKVIVQRQLHLIESGSLSGRSIKGLRLIRGVRGH